MARRRRGKQAAVVAALLTISVFASGMWLARDEVRFALDFESLGRNAQGYPEYRHRETGMVFVSLPGGTFSMGTSREAQESIQAMHRATARDLQQRRGIDDAFVDSFLSRVRDFLATEGPEHEVTLSPFLIGKYEVSQAQWKALMPDNPSSNQGDEFPVEVISWADCKQFCEKAGFTLPTEAQWEYACRAGTGTLTSFGDVVTHEQANVAPGNRFDFQENPPAVVLRTGFARPYTKPVNSYEPNGFGIHNMHGNVMEWCEDVYDPEFYSRAAASRKDPVAVTGSEKRVVRGSAFFGGLSRSAARSSGFPERRARSDRGFRVAYSMR